MKKYIAFIATLLFFACVTVFTMQMKQDDANADLSLTEKVTIMANAGDGNGDEDNAPCYHHYNPSWIIGWYRVICQPCLLEKGRKFEHPDECENPW